jgi:hypothetical protein
MPSVVRQDLSTAPGKAAEPHQGQLLGDAGSRLRDVRAEGVRPVLAGREAEHDQRDIDRGVGGRARKYLLGCIAFPE